MICTSCGDTYQEPKPEDQITAPGGWCMPAETAYALPEPPSECPDCRARMLMMMELGIDPGRHGENLRVPRGGITYPRPHGDPDA